MGTRTPRRSGLALTIMTLAAAGCATVPSGPLREGEVRVARLTVPDHVPPGSYQVIFEGVQKYRPDIALGRACFVWATPQFRDGPYCFGLTEDAATQTARAQLITRNPNTYSLYGTVHYSWSGTERESNTVSATLTVR